MGRPLGGARGPELGRELRPHQARVSRVAAPRVHRDPVPGHGGDRARGARGPGPPLCTVRARSHAFRAGRALRLHALPAGLHARTRPDLGVRLDAPPHHRAALLAPVPAARARRAGGARPVGRCRARDGRHPPVRGRDAGRAAGHRGAARRPPVPRRGGLVRALRHREQTPRDALPRLDGAGGDPARGEHAPGAARPRRGAGAGVGRDLGFSGGRSGPTRSSSRSTWRTRGGRRPSRGAAWERSHRTSCSSRSWVASSPSAGSARPSASRARPARP